MQPCPCIPSNSFGGSPPFPPGLLVYNPPWLVWYTWETHLCKKIALSWKSNNYRSQNGRSPFQWRNARRGVLKLNISPCRTHITFSSRAGIQVQVLLHVTSQEYSCFDEIKLKNSFCDHPCVNFPPQPTYSSHQVLVLTTIPKDWRHYGITATLQLMQIFQQDMFLEVNFRLEAIDYRGNEYCSCSFKQATQSPRSYKFAPHLWLTSAPCVYSRWYLYLWDCNLPAEDRGANSQKVRV